MSCANCECTCTSASRVIRAVRESDRDTHEETIDWEEFGWTLREPKVLDGMTISIEDSFIRCDHETCYEEHAIFYVFKVIFPDEAKTEKFFRIEGEWSSYGGTEWHGALQEVKPKVAKVTEWASA